jgi:ElaB/YqjD/DUF883 family membrane-anchored ribosome-binding protein
MTQGTAGYPLDDAKGATEGTDDRLRAVSDSTTDQFKGAAERAQRLAGEMNEQAREYSAKAQTVAKEFKPFVERSLNQQPLTTLAGAAIIGFILGAIWKK